MTDRDIRLMELARLLYTGEAREKQVISPQIVWHVPGHNPVSGDYRGHDEYFGTMVARMGELRNWNFDLRRVMVNGEYVVTQFHVDGDRKDRHVDMSGSHVLRFDASDQIVEGWGFVEDADTLDEFFAA